jgi:hypothetical protein
LTVPEAIVDTPFRAARIVRQHGVVIRSID